MPDLSTKTRILNWFRAPLRAGFVDRITSLITQGASPMAMRARFVPHNYQYEKGSERNVIRNGIDYKLDLSEYVDWYLYYGLSDPSRDKLYNLVQPGDHVIDVGANIGEVALMCSKRAGSNGYVLAIEPCTGNFQNLKKNIDLNEWFHGEHLQIALGDSEGSVSLVEVENHNAGMNRVAFGSLTEGIEEVQLRKLDEVVDELGLERVDLIKIDVEGFELHVLRGAAKTIERFRPKLFVEIDPAYLAEFGSSVDGVEEFLSSFDYQITRASEPDTRSKDEPPHFDILALPG